MEEVQIVTWKAESGMELRGCEVSLFLHCSSPRLRPFCCRAFPSPGSLGPFHRDPSFIQQPCVGPYPFSPSCKEGPQCLFIVERRLVILRRPTNSLSAQTVPVGKRGFPKIACLSESSVMLVQNTGVWDSNYSY